MARTRTASSDTNPHVQAPSRWWTGAYRWWVVAVVAVVLLLVADRAAAWFTDRQLASAVQSAQQLSTRPQVAVRGFPFLSQALAGRYREVDLSATGPIRRQGVEVSRVAVQLHGVKVSAGDALRGTVRQVPVTAGTGAALITYQQLGEVLNTHLGPVAGAFSLAGGTPGQARLSGPLGLSVAFTASIAHGQLTLVPDPADLNALPALPRNTLTSALSSPIALPSLPFNVELASGRFTPDGLALTAAAHNSLFPVQ